MSYAEELGRELRAAGIPARRRERILLEIEDHLAADPSAELGDPRALSRQFAEELGAHLSRRAALATFAALALAGLAYTGAVASPQPYPDITSGRSTVLAVVALLGLVVAPQVAFVAGTLAVVRALRLRRERVLPAGELLLLRRRAGVGVVAGLATLGCVALHALNFWSELPLWWTATSVSLAAAASVPLAAAGVAVVRAGGPVVRTAGPARDLVDDLPLLERLGLRGRPWRLCLLVGVPVVFAMLAAGWRAEHSFGEGVFRAGAETVFFAAGFLTLGRYLGLRRR